MDKKSGPAHLLLTRDPPQNKRPTQTKVKGWKKIFKTNGQENNNNNNHGVVILKSDKIDFKTKGIKRDRKGYFIMLKGRIHQEDINIVNIYAPNIRACKYTRKSWRTARKR